MAEKKKSVADDVWGYEDAGKTGKQAFIDFLYNKKKGEVLGRTAKSWGLIGLFYLVYYALLAAWWTGLLWAFFATTSPDYPSWIAGNGIIGNNPGLGFRPHPSSAHEADSLLWFKDEEENQMYWKEAMEEFLHPYEVSENQSLDYVMNCDDKTITESPDQKACSFNLKQLGDFCSKENKYGHNSTDPCVLLKLNKIYAWIPTFYETVKDIPSKLPENLKSKMIESSPDGEMLPSRVWVWCDGQNDADKENIGKLEYYPYPGFHTKYFPYMKVEGYKSPLVAIRFAKAKPNVMINVECKLWWPEVVHNSMDRLGMVRFEVLIDPPQ